MGKRRSSTNPVNVLLAWVQKQSLMVKIFLGVVTFVAAVFLLRLVVRDHDHFFVASEAIHMSGIMVLAYKLITQKTCSGLSLKSQVLTSIFLAVRVLCSYAMEGDIHTVLDLITLVATLWVIYMIKFKLKMTYIKELDNFPLYYIVVPAAILAVLVHPHTMYVISYGILWAFCVYVESVSVLPQLRLMQNAKMVEPFTAHYVFALGVARFLACAHWIIRIIERGGSYIYLSGSGYFWPPAIFLAEIVQTFILADFCYYYVKSVIDGQKMMSLPSMV